MILLEVAAHISKQASGLILGIVIFFTAVLLIIIFTVVRAAKEGMKKRVYQKSFQKPSFAPQMKKILEQIQSEGFRPADVMESKAFVESQGIDFEQIILCHPNKDQIIPISKWESIYFLPDAGTNKDNTANWHIFVVKE